MAGASGAAGGDGRDALDGGAGANAGSTAGFGGKTISMKSVGASTAGVGKPAGGRNGGAPAGVPTARATSR